MMFGPASSVTVVENTPAASTESDMPLTLTTVPGVVRPASGMLGCAATL